MEFSLIYKITIHIFFISGGQQVLDHGNHSSEIIFFFDRLFDSVNGSRKLPSKGKLLRCGISDTSAHIKFWMEEAVPLLDNMKFLTTGSCKRESPPSLKNWPFTLKNIKNIWTTVKENGFEYLLGRHLNQDPIENLFGQIRSHGARNSNPTSSSFIRAFKVMCVNSTLNLYNPTFNCEQDDCTVLCEGLKCFFKPSPLTIQTPDSLPHPLPPTSFVDDASVTEYSEVSRYMSVVTNNYVSGFLLKKIKKKVFICSDCKTSLFCGWSDNPNNALISAREYGGAWAQRLCYPTENFAQCFNNINDICTHVLKTDPHNCKLSEKISDHIKNSTSFDYITCSVHKLEIVNYIIKLSIRTLVHAYCKNINRIIMGLDSRGGPYNDCVKRNALEICNRRRKFKK